MISNDLRLHLRAGAAAAHELVGKKGAGTLFCYRWEQKSGDISATLTWKRGDPALGMAEPFRPLIAVPELESKLALAAINTLHAEIRSGMIWAGRGFSFWQVDVPSLRFEASLEVVEASLTRPSFLFGLFHSVGRPLRPELLSALGRRLRRDQTLKIWESPRHEMSAHERIALSRITAPAAVEIGLDPEKIESTLRDMVHLKGLDHMLWRTPEGQPDVVLLIADSSLALTNENVMRIQAVLPI